DEARYRRQLKTPTFGLLPQLRNGGSNCFPHQAPMYSELLRYSGNRAYAELVLSADLFKQLHLRSPIQRVPPSRADARIRVPIRLEGGPKQNAELDQIRIPKSQVAWRGEGETSLGREDTI